ncbi:CHAT domain-containing protein [Streptomyces boninensis]|uniref:CHAT domain-containing protein n=1 Tax=Streptomyces boninensis TaxID=2039455 RepID=UPI003B20E0A4
MELPAELAELRHLLNRAGTTGSAAPLLTPEAALAAGRTILAVPPRARDLTENVLPALANWHLARFRALAAPDDADDYEACVRLSALIVRRNPGALSPGLRELALGHAARHPRGAFHPAPSCGPVLVRCAAAAPGNAALLDVAIDVLRVAESLADEDDEERVAIAGNLCGGLRARYGRTGAPEDLAAALRAGRAGAAVESVRGGVRMVCLNSLGNALADSFDAAGDLEDLSEAITVTRAAAAELPADAPMRQLLAISLAGRLSDRYRLARRAEDFDAALASATSATSGASEARGATAAKAHTVLTALWRERFADTRDPAHIDAAVAAGEAAVAATPPGEAYRPNRLIFLADALMTRSAPDDLDRALNLLHDAARLASGQRELEAMTYLRMARNHETRFSLDGDPARLGRGIDMARRGADLAAPASHVQAECLTLLGQLRMRRFVADGELPHLKEALAAFRGAAESMPRAAADYPAVLVNLAGCLHDLGKCTDETAPLREAVDTLRAALRAAPDRRSAAPVRQHALAALAETLFTLHDHDPAPRLLAEAVAAVDEADAETPAAAADMRLTIAELLLTRYRRTRRPADLDRAIEISRHFAESDDRQVRRKAWTCLSQGLTLRTEVSGSPAGPSGLSSLSALNAAVDSARRAVAAGVDKAASLGLLADALLRRAQRTGSVSDAEEAVRFAKELAALPEPQPRRQAGIWTNLATTLVSLYDRSNRLLILSEAIEAYRRAVPLLGDDDPDAAALQSNLGVALRRRHERMGNPDDLDEAVLAGRRAAAALAPADTEHDPEHDNEHDPERGRVLGNLGITLTTLFQQQRDPDPAIADEAVLSLRAALDATPDGHSMRAMRLFELGRSLWTRLEHSGSDDDYAQAVQAFREAVAAAGSDPAARDNAARFWGTLAAAREDWAGATEGWTAAIENLPRFAWLGLDRTERERLLEPLSGMASEAAAAALALGDPGHALALLEQGRTVLWNQDLQLRDERAALAEADPELHRALTDVGRRLAEPSAPPADPAREYAGRHHHAAEQRLELAHEWDALVERVRLLPGFEDFLTTPPSAHLQRGLGSHPVVVINIHPLRSDAIIVTGESVTHLPLPALGYDEVSARADSYLIAVRRLELGHRSRVDVTHAEQTLAAALEWLWDTMAEPVLEHVGHHGPPPGDWPGVTWCPTGPLALLPIHAAGYHDPGGRGRSVLDRVVSSYTPSVRAAARPHDRADASRGRRLLIAAVPESPGDALPDLPAARAEARTLAEGFPDRTGRLLIGPEATHAAVTGELARHAATHFACHGTQHPDEPASGAIHLHDTALTIRDIAALRLEQAEFAYLSACKSAAGAAGLPDEAIHLAAALQLAGYRHVIATLWSIDDQDSAQVALRTYELMGPELDFTTSAACLHRAVRELRDAHPYETTRWAPYVHFGGWPVPRPAGPTPLIPSPAA